MDEGTRTGRAGQEGKGIEKGGENSDFLSPSEGVQTNGAMRVGSGVKTLFQIFVAIKLRVLSIILYYFFSKHLFAYIHDWFSKLNQSCCYSYSTKNFHNMLSV